MRDRERGRLGGMETIVEYGVDVRASAAKSVCMDSRCDGVCMLIVTISAHLRVNLCAIWSPAAASFWGAADVERKAGRGGPGLGGI